MLKNFPIYVLIIFLLTMAGCARKVWFYKPGTSKQEFYRDKSSCKAFANVNQNASTTTRYHRVYGTVYKDTYNRRSDRKELYLDCMRGKGYNVSFKKPNRRNNRKSSIRAKDTTWNKPCVKLLDCPIDYECANGECIKIKGLD